MVLVTLMWSIAGVVSRHIEAARGFEMTFWRSFFNALSLLALLLWLRGPATLWRSLRSGGAALWVSGLCWCVMFTAFMLALTLTTVANVLVTMALGPLFTALASRLVLRHALPGRTWLAILLAGVGIAWMYGGQLAAGDAQQLLGTLVALGVPLAAATNWTLLQHLHHPAPTEATEVATAARAADDASSAQDMLPAVLIGAVLSALLTLLPAQPFAATPHDLGLLGLLGLVQLAIPCLLAVQVARVLKAPEVSLLSLLEVVLGVAWAWLGAAEAPRSEVLGGGLLVLLALGGNEALSMRTAR